MMNQNKIIYGWWRCGTKLLAHVHQQIGYHNFGEFFNTFSCSIIHDDVPYAQRLPVNAQQEQRKLRITMSPEDLFSIKHAEGQERIKIFQKFKMITPSIVTAWIGDSYYENDVFSLMDDRFYLCPRRENQTEQLLSGLLTWYNLNYNGEYESQPIRVTLDHVDFLYKELRDTTDSQTQLVNEKKGRWIDFDLLITGGEDLGFDYIVDSQDQHRDLYSYFLNLADVLSRIHLLQKSESR